MGVIYDRLKFGSTAALDCHTGQNKDRYCKKELLLLLVSLLQFILGWSGQKSNLRHQ